MLIRLVLAILLVVVGGVLLVRLLTSIGLHREILPGLALAAAMIALGVHRITLIVRIWRAA